MRGGTVGGGRPPAIRALRPRVPRPRLNCKFPQDRINRAPAEEERRSPVRQPQQQFPRNSRCLPIRWVRRSHLMVALCALRLALLPASHLGNTLFRPPRLATAQRTAQLLFPLERIHHFPLN